MHNTTEQDSSTTTTPQDAQPKDYWLKCQLLKGMFSHEVVVTYPPVGEEKMSVFVPKEKVQGTIGSMGEVRVAIARREGKTFALLPATPYKEVVEVFESDVLTR